MSNDETPEPPPPPRKPGPVRKIVTRVRRPDRVHMAVLSQRVPYWFVAGFLFLFAVFQIEMNPFGFSDLTQRYTQDIADLLITGPYFYGTEGRDQVAIALIDEDTLQQLQTPWPWSYADHARMLDALRADKPKAVVVDFLFVDSRPDPTLPLLVDEIQKYKKDGIPLYFEGGLDTPYGESALRPEFAKTGVRILDPSIPVYNGVSRQYYITGNCFGAKPRFEGTCYSNAFTVFADNFPKTPLKHLNGRMELVWGTAINPNNAKWLGPACNAHISGFQRVYLAFFDPAAVQNPCPYDTVIPVVHLMNGDDPQSDALVTGKIVYYGGNLEGAQDQSYSPVNGKIASVFVHAMALDNLLTYRGRPQQNVMTIQGEVLSNDPAQTLAIVPVILVLTWLHMGRIRRKRRAAAREGHERSATFEYFLDKALETVWHWLAFGLALAVGLALTLASGLSVANWVEVIFVSVELAAMLLVGLPDSVWGYLHHVVAGDPPDASEGEQAA
ncbi:MAG: CHASE2 domain-containing protein [Rhizomicrobium sp.]